MGNSITIDTADPEITVNVNGWRPNPGANLINTFAGMVSACWWHETTYFNGYDNCDGFIKLSTYTDMFNALHGVNPSRV